MHPETFLVDRLHPQKHVMESQRFPELEDLLIAQQDIPARLQVVLFLDPSPRDRFPDLKSLLSLDKCHIINEEYTSFLNPFQFFNGLFRANHSVAAAVKGPGTTEGAIPGATSCKLD